MKTLTVITYEKESADRYCDTLKSLFGDTILINKYYVLEGSLHQKIEADLVVISTYDVYKLAIKYIPGDVQIISINLTLSKIGYERIKMLPPNTKALMVNFNLNLSLQCIEQIYQLGGKQIELIPYAPNLEVDETVKIALTPGESKLVPEGIKQVFELEHRVIDISTICYIAMRFDLGSIFSTPQIKSYYETCMPLNIEFGYEVMQQNFVLDEFMTLNYRSGIISFTRGGIVTNFNAMAEKILGFNGVQVIGEDILSLFPLPSIRNAIENMNPMEKKQVKINGQDIIVKIITADINISGLSYITLEKTSSRMLENKGRQTAVGMGHRAKYYFSDILTANDKVKKLITIAERNAETDSSVLITGESGTGKELFAQAIHNASIRCEMPFVAVNCAAVPEALLESELFGYEEGAFTGARKGGKKGLFEQASSGTLFLDEIGEMSIDLQARLLRVLQEKEIVRVGGIRIISIDVRIIAATNRKVEELVREKKFRLDLFYRLNVIPLKLIPLRKRTEDIELLIDIFKNQLSASFSLTEEAIKCLKQHGWAGNVRELRNYVEYMRNLRKDVIELQDLPIQFEKEDLNVEKDMILEEFEKNIKNRLSDAVVLLKLLGEADQCKKRMGRRTLSEKSREGHVYISEIAVSRILLDLQKFGYVKILKGRGGTVITEMGLNIIALLDKN